MNKVNDVLITNTTYEDLNTVLWLFEEAIKLQGKNNYKVWDSIDTDMLKQEMENGLQYKILKDSTILCIFSIQYNDPFIWRNRDKNDALYLHRIVVNPNFKGQKQFSKVLQWAVAHALSKNLTFVRMDTWADNFKIIDYYKSFGFKFVETHRTSNTTDLPIQNRNLNVALLEIKIDDWRSLKRFNPFL